MTEYEEHDGGILVIWSHDEGGYDWSATALLARKKEDSLEYEYAVHSDSGCSCTYFMEDGPEGLDLDWTTSETDIKLAILRGVDGLYDVTELDRFDKKRKAIQALRKHRDETGVW